MLNCKFCNKECKSDNSLRNHERLCKQNPLLDDAYMHKVRAAAHPKVQCQHCNNLFAKGTIKKHEKTCLSKNKICLECNIHFREREKNQIYCSNKCSSIATRYKPRKDNNYRTLCFRAHEKKCVVCGFDNIVAVHHYDCDKKNNNSENLIPLCPNHHEMIHHRLYTEEITKIVDNYLYNRTLPSRPKGEVQS